MDILVPFQGVPRYDQKSELLGILLEGGGPASTAAVALHRLGCRVRLLTVLGDDPLGELAWQSLEREGLSTDGVIRRKAGRTPLSIILADPEGGARTVLWDRGTLAPLDPSDVKALWQPAKLILVDETYPEAAETALQLAHDAGALVVFDAGTAGPGLEELVRQADVLAASEAFPIQWTGISDPLEATKALQSRNGHPIIVTRGSRGAWLHDGVSLREFPAFPVPARDSTAAGDAFHAAIAFGILQSWPWDRMCRFANFYASQNCLQLGGRAGLLRIDQIGEWLVA